MDYKANKKYIDEIFKYCDMYSILVINPDGRLERVYCPFRVEVIRDVQVPERSDKRSRYD